MGGRIRGDPERLEAFGQDTRTSHDLARAAIRDCGAAVRAYNRAGPNDLGLVVEDRSAGLARTRIDLERLARLLEAHAFALRQLDRLGVVPDARAEPLHDALVAAALARPAGTDEERLADAAELLAERQEASRAEGAELAEQYAAAWSDPHLNAHVDALLATRSDDAAFILGFVERMAAYDPQALAESEADRLNGGLSSFLFGPSYVAIDGELVEVQELGIGGFLRALRGGRAFGRPLSKPVVASPKLQHIVDNLYKGVRNPSRVGTGTTADAVRHELLTGATTHGRSHLIKARDEIRALRRWLRRNPDAPYRDRLIARSLLDDLEDALRWGGGR